MITPSFSICQDGQFLTIKIHAPYANVGEADVEYYEKTFVFTAEPYFLRLFLPCEVIFDESGACDYDADSGHFTVKVPKKNEDEHFPNLDMLQDLLKAPQISAKPVVEEIEDDEGEEDEDDVPKVPDEELYADQKLREAEKEPKMAEIHKCGYGFGWQRHGVFDRFDKDLVKKLVDVSSPETSFLEQRARFSASILENQFDCDHYACDLIEPTDQLSEILKFKISPAKHFKFSKDDENRVSDLPKTRKLPKVDDEIVAWSLIDILAAYLYDFRTNEGEDCVESGWTIAKLAPSLNHLVQWTSPKDAVVGFARSVLVKPLYRTWDLLTKVLEDLVATLKQDRSALLHCLLQIQRIMNISGDFRYLFNDLFITDYCLWVRAVDESVLTKLATQAEEAVKELKKADLGLDLDELELEIQMATLDLKEDSEEKPSLDSDDEEDS